MPKWRKPDFELEIKARRKQILEAPLNFEKWPHSPDCHLLIEAHRWRCSGCWMPFYEDFRMACNLRYAIISMLEEYKK